MITLNLLHQNSSSICPFSYRQQCTVEKFFQLFNTKINPTFSDIALTQRFKYGTAGCKYNKDIYLNYIYLYYNYYYYSKTTFPRKILLKIHV